MFDLSVLCQKIEHLYNMKKIVFDIVLNYNKFILLQILYGHDKIITLKYLLQSERKRDYEEKNFMCNVMRRSNRSCADRMWEIQ